MPGPQPSQNSSGGFFLLSVSAPVSSPSPSPSTWPSLSSKATKGVVTSYLTTLQVPSTRSISLSSTACLCLWVREHSLSTTICFMPLPPKQRADSFQHLGLLGPLGSLSSLGPYRLNKFNRLNRLDIGILFDLWWFTLRLRSATLRANGSLSAHRNPVRAERRPEGGVEA